jgi:hypothetical protein
MGSQVYAFVLGVLEFICFFAIFFVPVPAFVAAIVLAMALYFGIGVMRGWLKSIDSRGLAGYVLGKFIYPVFIALFMGSFPGGAVMVAGFASIALLDSLSTAISSYYLPSSASR